MNAEWQVFARYAERRELEEQAEQEQRRREDADTETTLPPSPVPPVSDSRGDDLPGAGGPFRSEQVDPMVWADAIRGTPYDEYEPEDAA